MAIKLSQHMDLRESQMLTDHLRNPQKGEKLCVAQVIREHIASHGGYEINTEGDAFYVAFKQVSSAVLCAMEIQYRLMETEWSKHILKMPGCREASNSHGEPAFKGPRVRMGIHWAVEGTVAHR